MIFDQSQNVREMAEVGFPNTKSGLFSMSPAECSAPGRRDDIVTESFVISVSAGKHKQVYIGNAPSKGEGGSKGNGLCQSFPNEEGVCAVGEYLHI